MAHCRTVALIGLHTLERIGVRGVLSEHGWLVVASYVSFQEYREVGENADGFIVDASTFLHNLDFFLPRRQNVVMLSRQPAAPGDNSGRVIYPDSDEADIEEMIGGFIERVRGSEEPQGELSAREKDVLRLLVAGKINKEIADELCISINTVITHRKNISAKTGIKSVSGLSLYALMNGLCTP